MHLTMWLAEISADKANHLFGDVLPWLITLVVLILIGAAMIFFVRRWTRSDGDSSAGNFTLQDLRDLHAAGELSDDEFDRAKAAMIGRLANPSASKSRPSTPPPSTGNHGPTSN